MIFTIVSLNASTVRSQKENVKIPNYLQLQNTRQPIPSGLPKSFFCSELYRIHSHRILAKRNFNFYLLDFMNVNVIIVWRSYLGGWVGNKCKSSQIL